jgi:hypothetical protein
MLLIAFLIGVVPMVAFFGEASWVGSCSYGIAMSVFLLAPRFTRVFHVAPFTIGQIKKLVAYRCSVFLGAVAIIGSIYLALASAFSWDWNPGFGLWYFFYAELYFAVMAERLRGFHEKKRKTNAWLVIWTCLVMIASCFMLMGLAEDLPLHIQYLIQTGLLLLYLPYPMSLFKNMDFYDYCQVRDIFGGRPIFLE